MRSWFANPLALHLLWLLPALTVLAALAWRRRQRALAQLGPMTAVRALASARNRLRTVRSVCWGLCLVALALAVAGPRWGRTQEQDFAPGRDLVAVLDLSRSMLARDVLPNRCERAKEALLDLSRAVERRGGHRLALVVFAARPRVACPLTHDYDHFRAAVAAQDAAAPHPEIRPVDAQSISGTRIGAALLLAAETQDPRFRGYQDIILISDGDDPARDAEWREPAGKLGIPVHVVGLGDPETPSTIPGKGDEPLHHEGRPVQTRLEEEPLREIKQLTRGTYTEARTHTLRLGELFHEAIEPAAAREDSEDALTVYQPRSAWFFAAALAFLTLEMALGWISGPAKIAAPAQPAGAELAPGSLSAPGRAALLFLPVLGCLISATPPGDTPDLIRQAVVAFGGKDYAACVRLCEQAEERATDPGLVAFNKAAALYQLGLSEEDPRTRWGLFLSAQQHYRFCLEDATGARRARSLFDLGNALLQQAQDRDARLLEQAIEAYDVCLREPATDSGLRADARHNLELAKALWLRARAKRAQSDAEPESADPTSVPRDTRPDPATLRLEKGGPPRGPAKLRSDPGKGGDPAQGSTTTPPPPGRGNVPPLPDDEDLANLAPEDLAEHLRRAAERIERERAEHYRRTAPAPSRKVRDW